MYNVKANANCHGMIEASAATPPISHTLSYELCKHNLHLESSDWVIICVQILEAVNYLRVTVDILHNDIKGNNIIFGKSSLPTTTIIVTTNGFPIHVVLVDFGKATTTSDGKLYCLTHAEKEDYWTRYSYLAPEVIEGESKQSTHSDMYAVGGLFYSTSKPKYSSN